MSDERFERLERKIDGLTTAVVSRFDQVDARFDQVDARFDQVDARFDQVDARFDQVDARFDQVDARFDRLEKYLKSIETTQGHINGELSDQVADHERRIAMLDSRRP